MGRTALFRQLSSCMDNPDNSWVGTARGDTARWTPAVRSQVGRPSGPVPPVSVRWSRPGVPQGVGYPRRAKAGPVQFRDAIGRSCVGSTQAPAATGQCVDGHARNCYSDHPVGTASQRPSDCRRRLSSREICPEQSFGHPAPTPAVVVCARSLLENGRDESQKPVRAIHTYFCTFGLYVN